MAPNREGFVLPLDKPAGPTSHDVVAAARRALRERRIGHTGTLDPFASGLLLLCVGAATRIAEYITGLPKTYRAVIRFGTATDTDDRTGDPIAISETWRTLTAPQVAEALAQLTGLVRQVPPVYSAKKVGGAAMHRLARAGIAPAPVASTVRIDRIELLDLDLPDATIEIACSAGTYVRAVARDVGAALRTHAHLTELRRTRIGRHLVENALALKQLDDDEAVRRLRISALDAVDHLPIVRIDERAAATLRQGAPVTSPVSAPPEGTVAIALGEELVAIAEAGHGRLQPRKVLASA